MSLRAQVGDVRRRILCSLHRRLVPLGTRGPIVTFSFDDFPRTALTVGASILESFGARATYYVTMSLMNTRNDLGELFRREDLSSVLDRGHELASHTFSHLSARRVKYEAFRDDVKNGERAIREAMGVPGSGNFAYPYGDVTLGVKKKLGPQLMSSRGTCGGLNVPDVDLNLLRANSLYGDIECADAARRLIQENEEQEGWLIFYSHDVATKPSRFGCTPRLLDAICSFAGGRGARFMTVAQVLRELAQQSDPESDGKSQRSRGSLRQSNCEASPRLDCSNRTVAARSCDLS
jgi:peptidoglycan/xylan/chitin deacetylase (PgdA/CDA1 family)